MMLSRAGPDANENIEVRRVKPFSKNFRAPPSYSPPSALWAEIRWTFPCTASKKFFSFCKVFALI